MKKRVTLITVAALLLLGAFLLIMTRLHSPTEVLAPPNPNGEHRQLQQAFEEAVGKSTDYQLQYPDEGEYRSAYVLYDIDGDEESEALVFYTKNADESNVRVNILDLNKGKWQSILDESGYGNKIDSVVFSDLNNDGTAEVILSWSLAGADSSRTMTVHSAELENGKPSFTTLSNMPYKAMGVVDMDHDGQQEVLVLWNETTQKVRHNYAALMKLTANGLHQYGDEVPLDSTASVYDGIYLQEGNKPIAFVDALKDDNTMFTEVLWWDDVNQTLKAPFTDNETRTNRSTLRSPAIPTTDIDGDGIYEIPVAYGLPENYTGSTSSRKNTEEEEETRIYLTAWSVTGTAEPGVLQPKSYSLVDTENKYILRMGSGYRDSLIAYRNNKTGVITVYEMPDRQRGEPLFSLVYSSEGKPKNSKEYTFLALQGERVVYGSLTSAGASEGFTDDNIQDSLVFY